LGNVQRPCAVDACRGGVALARERVLGGHGHAWQWSFAACSHAVESAPGHGRGGRCLSV
jgi:hypothetical protein